MKIKFSVMTDLHTEFIHDAPERLSAFMRASKLEKCDFCIELGDFSPPGEIHASQKRRIKSMLDSFDLPFYHVLGNHDLDDHTKSRVLAHFGMDKAYYSFDAGQTHFVVLDACCFFDNGEAFDYDNGNYRHVKGSAPCIPQDQLDWLALDLAGTKYKSVIFSHQSLIESRSSISNADELRAVLSSAPHGVLAAICGHEHVDRLEKREGIYYYCLNSASYYWSGSAYDHSTYGEELEREYPHLRNIFPYKAPLFAIIEINEGEMLIRGSAGEFVGATPEELHFKKFGLCDSVTATVKDHRLSIEE